MAPPRRKFFITALEFLDVLVLSGTALLGIAVYSEGTRTFGELLSMRVKLVNVLLFGSLLALCNGLFRSFGLYRSRRLSRRRDEVLDIVKAVSACVGLVMIAALVFRIEVFLGIFPLLFWLVATGAMLASRLIIRAFLDRARAQGRNLNHLLIVGTNHRALEFASAVGNKPELGYHVIGFADDPWSGLKGLQVAGYPVVTDLQNVDQFLRQSVVDEVVIGLPLKSHYQRVQELVEFCEKQGILVRLIGALFNVKLARAKAEPFEDQTLVSLYTGQIDETAVLVKRLLDVSVSLVLLVLLAPLFAVTAVLIKCTSQGPVIFAQERVGINKRRFRLYKFRTMVVDAEQRLSALESLNEVSGPVFKMSRDPRITPLGRFLRKISVDEMPQLFNVLKGDMSLVGPRPLPVRDYNGFSEDWHRRRFSVRPGITCLWQVNGRSALPFERWMELDLHYIDNWSLWLDLKILARTLPAVLRGSGAA